MAEYDVSDPCKNMGDGLAEYVVSSCDCSIRIDTFCWDSFCAGKHGEELIGRDLQVGCIPHCINNCGYYCGRKAKCEQFKHQGDSNDVDDIQDIDVDSFDDLTEDEKKSVIEKIDEDNILNTREFVDFIRAIEEGNPGKNWRQIITKLHAEYYEEDVDLSFFSIRLFKNGPENEGYDNVDTIIHRDGTRFNTAHTYAGIRAGLNRGRVTSWFMTNVNTGWGDTVQVLGEYLKFNFKGASGYKSPDEVLGNKASKVLQTDLKNNPGKKLSQAYADYFGLTGAGQKKSSSSKDMTSKSATNAYKEYINKYNKP